MDCKSITDCCALMYIYANRHICQAFGCMTLLFLFSISPFRKRHYEAFWFLHVLLVPLTIVMAALHHPPVWWWCWAALALWIGERSYRLIWWLNTNGYLGGLEVVNYQKSRKAQSLPPHYDPETLPMHSLGQPKGLGRLPVLPRINSLSIIAALIVCVPKSCSLGTPTVGTNPLL